MEAKSWKIASGGSPLCELRFQHAFFEVFVTFACFGAMKNRCFLWKVLQIWGFCVYCSFLSLCSLRPHFGPILASFLRSKIDQNPSQGVGQNYDFLITFFLTILAILGPLGASLGSPRGRNFRLIFAFLGLQEANLPLHAPSGASLDDFSRFWLFSGVFFDVFSLFFWYILWYFFPMILTLIRATEEKLDR